MGLQDLTPQLRTRLRRVEKIVGVFVAVATLLLFAGFFYYLWHTAKRKGWFVEHCPYHTFVQSAEGLNLGDPIMLMGFSVGEITSIEAQPPGSYYHVFVAFEVRRPYYGYIWSDSKMKIAASGFLGERRLEITVGYDGKPTVTERHNRVHEVLVDGKMVPLASALKGPFMPPLEETPLTERAEKLVGQVEQALPSFLGLTNQIQGVLSNVTQLTANLDRTVAGTHPILTNVTQLTANLTEITANLRNPQGSLGEWIIPTNMQTQLAFTLAAVNTNLLSLNETILNVAGITSNLNAQVQSNDQILSELSQLVTETDDLVQGLKRHWLLKGAFSPGSTNAPLPILEPELK
jgi:ABC-type transporter Mla subunit MlaD